MNCVIFAGGSIADYTQVTKAVESADIIICADSGILHAERLGVVADYWVGDLDSTDDNHQCGEFIKLPTEKDDTDTMSAARLAVELGVDKVQLFGWSGTRLDHTFGNLFVLKFLLDNGVDAVAVDEHNSVFLIEDDQCIVEKKDGRFLSLLPFCCEATVSLTGVKYPLSNYALQSNHPIGISNEIVDDFCTISVEKGTVAVFLSCD